MEVLFLHAIVIALLGKSLGTLSCHCIVVLSADDMWLFHRMMFELAEMHILILLLRVKSGLHLQ